MRNTRLAGQALSLASPSTPAPYICRACLLQSTRSLSTSVSRSAASDPFYKRIQNSLFGTKESKAAEKHREEARQKMLEEIKEQGPDRKLEIVETARGVQYQVADVVDPTTHSDYVISRDWKGMEKVGGEEWVRARADSGVKYTGFLPPKQVKLESEEWMILLHRIVVEVFALRKAGRDVLQVCNPRISNAESGNMEGASEMGKQEKAILSSISETAQEERAQGALAQELAQALASPSGPSLLDLELSDPRIKFAILKRAMQLTGKRIPDIAITNATTLAKLHKAFAKKEAPKKLHDTEQLQNLSELGNIQVHESRRTHVHRDKAIGRWKLIEDELNLRNMPTRGRANV